MDRYSLLIISVFTLFFACPLYINAEDFNNTNKKFTSNFSISKLDWHDKHELSRVWDNSIVSINIDGRTRKFYMRDLSKQNISKDVKLPTIIWLHGCSGTWDGTHRRINFLSKNGYSVIAPQSFARNKYAKSCDPAIFRASMYREVIYMRHEDARHVIKQAKKLQWVDKNNLYLMGHSEGGIVTATYKAKKKDESVKARVIEGWTCRSQGEFGWPEYHGLNSEAKTPVLSLVGYLDPWFQKPWSKGDCGKFFKNKSSISYVFKHSPLSKTHNPLDHKEAQNILLNFLKKF
ncbi:MAG: dienelactone hydrolase family protein [Pseudomonadota bacterium]|nr:dienelactone hydrolase family protein [Pseudomonadota bacterium]